jgi:hypothetical protein
MQINSSTGVASAPLTSTKAVGAPMDIGAADAAEKEKAKKAGPLFSGGLANWNTMMTPDTLSALFALNEKGDVQFQENGAPVLAKGANPVTTQEDLLLQHVQSIHAQNIGDTSGLRVSATDEQKKFFHSVTGYNLVTENGGYGVYDDDGNMVQDNAGKDGRSSSLWQLADDITSGSLTRDGVAVSDSKTFGADWYKGWTDKMAAAGSTLPADWAAKAKAYFDDSLNALFDKSKDGTTKRGEAQQASQDHVAKAEDMKTSGSAGAPPLFAQGT